MKFLRTPLVRGILVALLLASIPLYVLQYTLIPKTGAFGLTLSGFQWSAPAADVAPNSSAWNAGIRDGDLVTIPDDQRERFSYPLARERVNILVQHAGAARGVSLTAAAAPIHFDYAADVRAAVWLCLFLFALLVVTRAWDSAHGPLIAAILTIFVANAATDNIPVVARTGPAVLVAANGPLSVVVAALFSLLPVILCIALLGRRSRTLRFLELGAILNVVLAATLLPYLYWPSVAVYLPSAASNAMNVWEFATICIPPAALLYAMCAARGEHRARLAWVFWGFFPFLFAIVLVNINLLWFVPPTIFNDPIFNTVARVIELSLPISLFYGLLVRRTIDIGFVVNRVAVYGLISAAVLGIFVLLEYLAGQFVEAHGAASWAIQLGIALAIGVSGRYLHGSVDRFVDRVFFAKRHADESTLKRFAREAEAFSTADALLDRAVETVMAHSETAGAAIYLCGEREAQLTRGCDTFPSAIDIDDPLLVALRRWNEPVDTHDAKTAFPDGMVFPMSARGKLIGALALRTKRDNTAFAPDEREPLADLARSLARALDGLGAKTTSTDDPLAQAIFTMQAMMLEIRNALSVPVNE